MVEDIEEDIPNTIRTIPRLANNIHILDALLDLIKRSRKRNPPKPRTRDGLNSRKDINRPSGENDLHDRDGAIPDRIVVIPIGGYQ